MDDKLRLKMMENRRRIEEEYKKRCRRQIGIDPMKRKADPAVDGDNYSKKRKTPAPSPYAQTFKPPITFWNQYGRMVFLFEFALGYALFDAHGVNQLPKTPHFKIVDEFLNKDPFKLIAFYRFASPREALVQMKAILNSTVTKELKSFLVNNLPKRIYGRDLGYQLAVSEGLLAHNIFEATMINVITGDLISRVMRGLREKIDQLIVGLKAPRFDKGPTKSGTLLLQTKLCVQRKFHVAKNLSLCYRSRQSCGCAT
ncbi:snoRNP complex protein nop56 [Orobanche minor]